MPADIYVWDVAHGLAVSILTSNGRWIVYDAGGGDWSPITYQRQRWDLDQIDLFVLSHAHADHLRDVVAVVDAKPRQVLRPAAPTSTMLREAKTAVAKSVVQEYEDEIDTRYNAGSDVDPFESGWAGTTHLRQFIPPDDDNPNNESRVLFVDCGGARLAPTGDLERKGWLALLDYPGFIELLQGTDVLVASHHGRETGVCEEALEWISPAICLISDGPAQATSTDRYSMLAEGWTVTDAVTVDTSTRYALTTRKDGSIHCRLDESGKLRVIKRVATG